MATHSQSILPTNQQLFVTEHLLVLLVTCTPEVYLSGCTLRPPTGTKFSTCMPLPSGDKKMANH
eukprot:4019371-Amphidinium_carterae.1